MGTQRGAILLSVLLFVVILTFLAMCILQKSWLENKMSNAYVAKLLSFYDAENKLFKYEQDILAGKRVNSKIAQKLDGYKNCQGVDFYRLTVLSKNGESKLQSTVAKVDDISKCNPKPNVTSGRQSFRVVF